MERERGEGGLKGHGKRQAEDENEREGKGREKDRKGMR